ncbi:MULTISPECIES: hypothetical protein [unclassified Streptomyces]|uniref:hypothetical protein n=1 Tax=unclassified Streptomyces TaxID=2593676 RepID=UPI002E2F4B00|nr:hypothetical protein [Streptomyces sp. NBC_01431]
MEEQVRVPEPQSYEVYADGLGMFAAIGIVFMVLGLWMLTGIRPWQGPADWAQLAFRWGLALFVLGAGAFLLLACVYGAVRPVIRANAAGIHLATRFDAAWSEVREIEVGTVAIWEHGDESTAGGYEHHRVVWVTLHSGRRHEYIARRQGGDLSATELRTGLSRFAGEVPVRWTDEVERRP